MISMDLSFCSETECFIHQSCAVTMNFTTAAPIDVLKRVRKPNIQDIYPNAEIALRTASCDRSFG